jgi:hypothetical protein
MTTKIHTKVALLGAFALAGCYSGIDAPRGNGQADGGADGADDGADDGDGDGADDAAGETEGEPGEPDGEAPFTVPGEEVDMLPFPVRMNNLSAVTGATLTHPIFFQLYDLRYQLGDHDYSNLQSPDLRWSPQKMQNWVKGLIPVCDSVVMQAKYPDLVADPAPLIQAAFGRDPVATDLEPLQDIATATYDDATKYRLTCITVLSSLEFVAS